MRLFFVFMAVTAALVLGVVPALAADTTVTLPWGNIVVELAHIASAILTPILMIALSFLPVPIRFAVNLFGGERLIRNAVAFGVNAVEGAAKDRTLTVDIGNRVLAQGVQYALDRGPPGIVKWLGGPEGIRQKLFRSLDLEAAATARAMGVAA